MPSVGPEVALFKPCRVSAGWRKHKQPCTACSGAGITQGVVSTAQVTLCPGCNGRGYVARWQRNGALNAKQR